MKKFVFMFIIASLSSCIKHTEPTLDSDYQIGNIYCSDGTILPIADYTKQNVKKAAGVIFYVYTNPQTPYKALILALDELPPMTWCDTVGDVGTPTDFNLMNGAENTYTTVCWALSNDIQTACLQAYNYSKFNIRGWFLPSLAEAMQIVKYKYVLLHSMEECGGEPFLSFWYWTSTQDNTNSDGTTLNAMAVSYLNEAIMPSSKLNTYAVRPIMAIK